MLFFYYINSSDEEDFETVLLLFPGTSVETSTTDIQDFKNKVLPISSNIKIHLEIDIDFFLNPRMTF